MLAHAEIVVGAPDGDVLDAAALAGETVAQGLGEAPGLALELGEDAIAPLGLEAGDHFAKSLLVVHGQNLVRRAPPVNAWNPGASQQPVSGRANAASSRGRNARFFPRRPLAYTAIR